jgi:PHD/YefM family antitoxin component YafN of YafNO toxin-antitoxin module
VANKRERFLIKRSGIPAAILLRVRDYEELQDLIDTWYEQQDRRDLRRLDAQTHRRVLAVLAELNATVYTGRIEARSAALTCMVSGLR